MFINCEQMYASMKYFIVQLTSENISHIRRCINRAKEKFVCSQVHGNGDGDVAAANQTHLVNAKCFVF